jgi:DNA-binding MarR family transcriptional regulator
MPSAIDSPPNSGAMVLLMRLAKVLYRQSSEQHLGMRVRQLVALSYLRDHGTVPQQQLCEALCVDANNLVLLLNSLEQAGHVRRRPDPGDRRRHVVRLTAAGRHALARAELAQSELEDEILGGLSPRERANLRGLLARALAAADTPEAPAAREPAGAAA